MEIFDRNKYRFSSQPNLVEISEEVNKLRAEQISSLEEELYSYKVLFKDLLSATPSYKDRNTILSMTFFIIENVDLLEYIQDKKKLPPNILAKKTMQPRGFIEKWNDYILSYVIIFSNPNYKLIQDYMKYEEIDEEKEEENKENTSLVPINIETDNSLRGLLIRKFKFSGCILTSMGEFKKVKVEADMNDGEEINTTPKKSLKDYKLYIAIAVVILILIGGGFFRQYYKIDRSILINTTSQVKLDVNSFGNVISSYSPTTKGEEMLKNLKINNKKLDKALEEILSYSKDNKMIPEGRIIVTITGNPLKYGTLEKTGEFVSKNNINLLVNNVGKEQKLFNATQKQKEKK
ncbi:hypothetical protein ACFO6R_07410 [Eubacterium multiforme]|uniref:RsgI N-terminal anti-sigma domain-containing protein n=1 Tax=Eubacterium multiforme TaxID=83339 RepID=A0ABT9UUI7_9FIRM|nr:hypothetical protein [Eubacterium multiforme]MDQ0149949.1 hypothetical protein [Eubacterium multiforme]